VRVTAFFTSKILDARDEDLPYLMAYSAVCMYANEDSSTFHQYHLTYEAIRDRDEEIETEEGNRYTKTTSDEWDQVTVEDDEDGGGRTIDPIECTVDEEFSVKIIDEELKTLMNDNKEIRYEKVFQWCLPLFGDNDQSLFKFQAARIRNYMKKQIVEENYKPRYYTGDKLITGVHVARFYCVCLGKMLTGGRSSQSIAQIFSTREIFDAVPSIQAAMTKSAL
jgi:hypothetical protein